jgi:uncharacterized protein with PQ loop repeat
VQQVIGWSASAVLVVTIASQIFRQYRTGTSKGVSTWLFVGQSIASLGFTVYSAMVGDKVFIFTNALMLVSALVGLGLVLHHRQRGR